jgi:hypothetical protein
LGGAGGVGGVGRASTRCLDCEAIPALGSYCPRHSLRPTAATDGDERRQAGGHTRARAHDGGSSSQRPESRQTRRRLDQVNILPPAPAPDDDAEANEEHGASTTIPQLDGGNTTMDSDSDAGLLATVDSDDPELRDARKRVRPPQGCASSCKPDPRPDKDDRDPDASGASSKKRCCYTPRPGNSCRRHSGKVRVWSSAIGGQPQSRQMWSCPPGTRDAVDQGLAALQPTLDKLVRAALRKDRNKATLAMELSNIECVAEMCIWTAARAHALASDIPPSGQDERTHFAKVQAEAMAWRFLGSRTRQFFAPQGVPDDVCEEIRLHLSRPTRVGQCAVSVERVEPCNLAGLLSAVQTCPRRSWRLHGLFDSAVLSCPTHRALHGALRKEIMACRVDVFDCLWCMPASETLVPGVLPCLAVRLPAHHDVSALGPTLWFRELPNSDLALLAVWGSLDALGPHSVTDAHVQRTSNFLPPQFRWTDTHSKITDPAMARRLGVSLGAPNYASGLKLKSFDCTGVISRRAEWFRRVPAIDSTCASILRGRFHYPTVPGGIRPARRPNLGSINEDKPLLYKLAAKYLIAGSLEYCPPGHEPDNIIPLGLVSKKDEEEPWRAIADGRKTNEDLRHWPSKMTGMKASAGLFDPGAFVFCKDFSSAYHNVPLGTACDGACVGCRSCRGATEPGVGPSSQRPPCTHSSSGLQEPLGDLRPLPSPMGVPAGWRQRRFVGCKPGVNCRKVGCQKQMFGVELDGVYFRFAVAHFGVRTAGNAFAALIGPLIRKWRAAGTKILLWVDDLCVVVPSTCPNPTSCGGVPTCSHCQACYERAVALDAEFTAEIAALGFETNRKDVGACQSAIFLGLRFDTLDMTFSIEEHKAAEFAEKCALLLQRGSATRRDFAKLVGQLMWWQPAVHGVRLMSRALQGLTCGALERHLWDEIVALTEAARTELIFWRDHIVRLSALRLPMRVPRLTEVLADWQGYASAGIPPSLVQARLTTDGGPIFWGAVLELPDGSRHEASGRYLEADIQAGHTLQQAWREGYAAILGFRSFLVQLTGKVVLHLSDCACVVLAMDRGSISSPLLHQQAVDMWHLTASIGALVYSGWVPGTEVIAIGADHLSREGAQDMWGYSLGPTFRSRVDNLLTRLTWSLTVDLFAHADNAQTRRFWSRLSHPDAAGVDAFTKPSWAWHLCNCGARHSETVLVFPPFPLLLPVWTRLSRDGAKGIAIVPRRPGSPWWPLMLEGKLGNSFDVTGDDLILPDCAKSFASGMRSQTYTVVAFDFSCSPVHHVVSCPQFHDPPDGASLEQDSSLLLMHSLARRWLLQPANLEASRLEGLDQLDNCQ